MKNRLLLGTRKGLIVFEFNKEWRVQSTHFLGEPVSYGWVDPASGYWWAALDHGHWGSKLHRSLDQGITWVEVATPAYPEGAMINETEPAALKYIWSFASGDTKESIYVGTEPGGLFKTNDAGDTFELVEGLWNHPSRQTHWFGGGRDFPGIHSIITNPHNSDHLLVGISVAGVFETKDGGKTWDSKNSGLRADFLPDPEAAIGQDPHLMVAAPSDKNTLWQQNHCGIFLSKDGGLNWKDVSAKDGPAYFGFAVAVDENEPDTAWVVPGISDQTRVPVDQALCVCRTEDGGESWTTLTRGLPQDNAFDITYRHAMDITENTLAFGTTTGNLYTSEDRGDSWLTISNNLPMIYSLQFF
jgi:photosystem II stability/assembly factor-like uncharacterized protein